MYDDVSNISNCEVAASLSQSYANGVAKSYLSYDECEVVDLEFRDEVICEKESDSNLFQSQSNDLNAEGEYSSDEDEGNFVDPSSYESDATWEEESDDESEFFHESEGMVSCLKSKNDNASQFLYYTNQFGYEDFESDLSSRFEDKEMVDQIDANEFEHEVLSERVSKGFTSDNEVVAYGKRFSDESWSIYSGHPKQGNEDDAIIDTICALGEKESKSLF